MKSLNNKFFLLLAPLLFSNAIAQTIQNIGPHLSDTEGAQLIINNKNEIYISYQDPSNPPKKTTSSVRQLTRDSLLPLGGLGFSFCNVFNVQICSDSSGAIYCAYEDVGSKQKLCVKKYNGSNWDYVGVHYVTDDLMDQFSMALDSSGAPWVAYYNYSNNDTLKVLKFNGEKWIEIDNSDLKHYQCYHFCNIKLAFSHDNIPYLAFSDNKYMYIKKFIKGNWLDVGEKTLSDNFTINFDKKGNLYRFNMGAVYAFPIVEKFNGSQWSLYGIPNYPSYHSNYFSAADMSLDFDFLNLPFIAYTTNSFNPVIVRFNGKQWDTSYLKLLSGHTYSDGYSCLKIDKSGIPYLVLSDYQFNYRLNVIKIIAGTPLMHIAPNPIVTDSSIECQLPVEYDGGTSLLAKGVCWSLRNNPDTSDQRSFDGQGIFDYSHTITGLQPGTTYYVCSYGINSATIGYSTVLQVKTLKRAQSITFDDLTARTYGDSDFVLSAFSSSSRTLSYTSSDKSVATINRDTVHILKVGTTTITAEQIGDSAYKPASAVEKILIVNKKPLIAKADNKSRLYKQSNPEFTISFNGFVNKESVNVLDSLPTASSQADQSSPGGTYSIDVGGGADNSYTYNCQNGILTVMPIAPDVATDSVVYIGADKAVCGGKILSDGGSQITAHGICWNTSGAPTIIDSRTDEGSGSGTFTSELQNLTKSTKYYYRAYATNSVRTMYGDELSFTTLLVSVDGNDIQNKQFDFSIYPNPTEGIVRLTADFGKSIFSEIKIYNILGNVVFQKIYPSSMLIDDEISIGNLPSGLYYIELQSGVERAVKKMGVR